MRGGARCALALLALAPLGCAHLPPGADGWRDFDFRMRGRLGVRTDTEAFSMAFDWRERGGRFAIELWGALGQGRALLLGDRREVRVLDGAGHLLERGELDAVARRALGWRAPVGALRYWVRGRPAPTLPVESLERDENGRFARFEQRDWVVAFAQWQPTALGEMPGRITATRGRHRLTVVGKEWDGRS